MATLTGQTIAGTYDQLVKRQDSYSSTGNRIELMNDSGTMVDTVLYLDAENDRVGIGTSTPLLALHIQKGASGVEPYANASIVLETTGTSGTGAQGYINFLSEAGNASGHGLIWTDTNGGSEAYLYYSHDADSVVIGGTSKVGIGVTDPDSALEVFSTSTQLKLSYDATDFCTFAVDTNHDITITPSSTGQIILKPTTDSVDFFQVMDANGGTPVLNVDSTNERVGIGLDAPLAPLHVRSAVSSVSPHAGAELILEADAGENYINFVASAGSSSGNGIVWTDVNTQANAYLYYNHDADIISIGGTADVKVGIGTETPETHLEISKDGAVASFAISAYSDSASYYPAMYFRKADGTEADPDLIHDDDPLGAIFFQGWDKDSGGNYLDGAAIVARINGTPAENEMPCDLEFFVNTGAATAAIQAMTIKESGAVGIGTTLPSLTGTAMVLNLTQATEGANCDMAMVSDQGDDNADRWLLQVAAADNHWRLYDYSSGSWDAQLRINTSTGNLLTDGTHTPSTSADYAEYFETSDGKSIAVGTTVVLVDGKIRASKDGETPLGVVRSPDATAVLCNGYDSNWRGKYIRDDFGLVQYENYDYVNGGGQEKTGTRKKISLDFDESLEYIPRSDRDAWQAIGLLGQVPIKKGQPVASSWIKMREVSDTVDMYYIFPCA